MFGITMMIVIIMLASAACKYVDRKTRHFGPSEAEKRLMDRMDELEQRLTDIQDIMIAIDDKMSRPEMKM